MADTMYVDIQKNLIYKPRAGKPKTTHIYTGR